MSNQTRTETSRLDRKARALANKKTLRTPEEIAAERALIIRVQSGEMEAFEELVNSYQTRVYWIAYNLVGSSEDAEDIAQEAFIRVHRNVERFDLRFNFYTWLYRIVVNLSIDRLRRRGKKRALSIDEFPSDPAAISGGPDADIRNRELGERIEYVLDSLPAKYKAVIVLRDMQELSCDAIAEIIGCTPATTRWRLHKARSLFRDKWQCSEV